MPLGTVAHGLALRGRRAPADGARARRPGDLGHRPAGDDLAGGTRLHHGGGRRRPPLRPAPHRRRGGDGASSSGSIRSRSSPSPRRPRCPAGRCGPAASGSHDDGTLHVVFGNHASRLDPDLRVLASQPLPRCRPYNSFVDPAGRAPRHQGLRGRAARGPAPHRRRGLRGAGARPGPPRGRRPARGAGALHRPVVGRRGRRLRRRRHQPVPACGGTAPPSCSTTASPPGTGRSTGQTYGWDCVLAAGAAWFLDDGEGTERFAGTFRGSGVSTAPLHLVRVDLGTGEVDAGRGVRAARRHRRQPAGGGRAAGGRRRLRQRQRLHDRLRHRHARGALAAGAGPRQPRAALRGDGGARDRRPHRRGGPRRRHRGGAGPRGDRGRRAVRPLPRPGLRPRLLRLHVPGPDPQLEVVAA